jgi:hypothetical protein
MKCVAASEMESKLFSPRIENYIFGNDRWNDLVAVRDVRMG